MSFGVPEPFLKNNFENKNHERTIFHVKSDIRENSILRISSSKITGISRVNLHGLSCDSRKFSCIFSCKGKIFRVSLYDVLVFQNIS